MADTVEVVIRIGKKYYDNLMSKAYLIPYGLEKAIANGTVLPKGHGRLIDADVLADSFEDNYEFCEALNNTPTVIEADSEVEE